MMLADREIEKGTKSKMRTGRQRYSRRHYEQFAQVLADSRVAELSRAGNYTPGEAGSNYQFYATVNAITDMFAADSSAFDRQQFTHRITELSR